MLSGETSRRVYVDANAVIDYIRERTLHDHGMRPTGRRAEVLRVCLGQAGRVYVAATAGIEAEKNLVKDLAQKLGHVDAERMKNRALKILYEYLDIATRAQVLGALGQLRRRRDPVRAISAASMGGHVEGGGAQAPCRPPRAAACRHPAALSPAGGREAAVPAAAAAAALHPAARGPSPCTEWPGTATRALYG